MYRGYNLTDATFTQNTLNYQYGKNLYEDFQKTIRPSLESYIIDNGILDAKEIQKDWFPEVNAHIFISHSHKDESLAIALAGWLLNKFGLKAFIDSCVWGYANDLLKILDNRYCQNNKPNSYDYDKRNYSTSHVHMLLMTALNKMIDKTECVFFLNTENSVSIMSGIENRTLSPWIYGEIETTRIIEKHLPRRKTIKMFNKGGVLLEEAADSSLNIAYPMNMSHLYNLTPDILQLWEQHFKYEGEKAVDELYKLTQPHKIHG